MKVICYPDPNIKPEKNARHIINFFGILGCIKINVLGKDESKKQEGNVVKHYFDLALPRKSGEKVKTFLL
ncbi:MAG: hypothetical protein LJD31_03765 [Wolbachia endosymbiont of Menacanthus eurysternus]|nr:hypothetical protein [Wolbachia endosymbiont of Menacanthus eurysternus]